MRPKNQLQHLMAFIAIAAFLPLSNLAHSDAGPLRWVEMEPHAPAIEDFLSTLPWEGDGKGDMVFGDWSASEILIASGYARPRSGAPEGMVEAYQPPTIQTADTQLRTTEVRTVLAMRLDRQTYSPLNSFEYRLDQGVLVARTGRTLRCSSDSSPNPMAPIMLVLDGAPVALDGTQSEVANFDLATDLVRMTSNYGDLDCGEPDHIRVSLTAPATVEKGSNVFLRSVVSNETGSNAATVNLTYTLPSHLNISSFSGSGFTCTIASQQELNCSSPALSGQEKAQLTIDTIAVLEGSGEVSCEGTSPPPTGRVSTSACWADIESYTIERPALTTDLVSPSITPIGEEVTWTVQVTNSGDAAAAGVQVWAGIPTAWDIVSMPSSSGCTLDSAHVGCSIGTLEVGETAQASFVFVPHLSGDTSGVCGSSMSTEGDVDDTSCETTLYVNDGDRVFKDSFLVR